MTLVLHWWHVPLALFICGAALLPFVHWEGGYFNFPSWHLRAALLLWFAAIAVAVGGLIA